ncbi:MAG TPA: MoaD/ThiS family protein [Nitrososphaerales archaeon]|nr:MoaD/ThiS family protein [Nitrososphaerales archaeon]
MIVRVLYFASAQGLADVKSEDMRLDDGSSLKEMAAEMLRLHPALKKIEPTIRYSVNFEMAEGNSRLRDGDEVGVLPPVAGG